MGGRDRPDGISERRSRRIRHQGVVRERDQSDGEVAAHVLRPPGERPQPATHRALRQAQMGGDPAVPHAQRGYLQPAPITTAACARRGQHASAGNMCVTLQPGQRVRPGRRNNWAPRSPRISRGRP